MPKKIAECTKAHLISVALPTHAATYTVISHQSVIDYVFTELTAAGFGINTEEYRCTADGQIAQGIYKLNFNSDPELSMMFAWTNSYNKQVRFKCGIGAYVNLTETAMVCGDMGNWARKHTGVADEEVIKTIQDQIANAHMYYNQLVADKELMKDNILTRRKQAQILGILFAEYQILTTEQSSIVRQQMDRPSHVYDDSNSLWAFYNFVTIALQHSHPKTWMEDQRVLHYFINSIISQQPAKQEPVEIASVIDPLTTIYVDPNQISLLDQIDEAETNQVNEIVEILDLLINAEDAEETLVTYTDPAGNTFETIEFHNAVTSDPGDDDDDDADIWQETPLKEEEIFEIDENQEWTGENSSHMSLEVAPEDRDRAERESIMLEEKVKENANFDDLVFDINDNTEEEDLTSDFF